MTRRFAAFALLACSTASLCGQSMGRPIPPVHGAVLSGEVVDLSSSLKGKIGVLVIGFTEGSRDEVAVWGRKLTADFRDSPTVLFYEMPVLASVPRILRGLVLRKIRESIPAPAQPRFLPILDHEAEWKTLAGFNTSDSPNSNAAYVLLVDPSGLAEWSTRGGATDAAYAELKRRVEQMRRSAPTPSGVRSDR